MPASTDDREIIEKAVAGDMHAFRLLVERHQAFCYRLAYRLVGSRPDAEDLTQEAFIRLWRNLYKYRMDAKLTTWLYKIVTNLCLDFLRSARRKNRKGPGDLKEAGRIASDDAADQRLIDEDARKAVEELAARLTPKQKAVFILRDLENLTMAEISSILSMPGGRVKSNLYYARKKMGE